MAKICISLVSHPHHRTVDLHSFKRFQKFINSLLLAVASIVTWCLLWHGGPEVLPSCVAGNQCQQMELSGLSHHARWTSSVMQCIWVWCAVHLNVEGDVQSIWMWCAVRLNVMCSPSECEMCSPSECDVQSVWMWYVQSVWMWCAVHLNVICAVRLNVICSLSECDVPHLSTFIIILPLMLCAHDTDSVVNNRLGRR
jgi:hypothetical protein